MKNMIEYVIIQGNCKFLANVFTYGLKEKRKTQRAAGGHNISF